MPELLSALLTDVVPRASNGYLIADTESAVADSLRDRVGDLQVLASLEGDLEPRAVVVMLSFGPRSRADLDRVAQLVEPGGTMVLLSSGEDVIAALLGADGGTLAPADWPRSADQVRRALTSPGRPRPTVHLLFGSADEPGVILTEEVAERAQPGDLPTALVAGALQHDDASVDDALDALVRSGGLDLAAAGWVAVVGGAGRDIYHLTAEGAATWAARDPRAEVWHTPDGELAAGVSLEQTLRDVLAAQDVPAFRELAAAVGTWVRTEPGASARPVIAFDQLTFSDGHLRWTLPDAVEDGEGSADVALTAGWQRFLHRLHARRESLPWPPLSTDAELVRSWARMSGVERPLPPEHDGADDEVGLRSQLSRATERSALLEDRIAALEETLELRDSQLAVREAAIRELRLSLLRAHDNVAKATADAAAVKAAPAYRLASQITLARRPKEFVRVAGNALDKRVKVIRRMR